MLCCCLPALEEKHLVLWSQFEQVCVICGHSVGECSPQAHIVWLCGQLCSKWFLPFWSVMKLMRLGHVICPGACLVWSLGVGASVVWLCDQSWNKCYVVM